MGKDEDAIGAFKDGKFDGTMKLGLGEGDTFEEPTGLKLENYIKTTR